MICKLTFYLTNVMLCLAMLYKLTQFCPKCGCTVCTAFSRQSVNIFRCCFNMLMINFVTFMHLLVVFLRNTGMTSTNFKNNFDAQNAGNAISRLQISKIFWPSATVLRSDFMAPPLLYVFYLIKLFVI